MANSKVNTEETILRTPTDTPANADANSVRVYTDGTNVYSKDASGTVVNLSGASGATTLDGLTDTNLSSLSNGEALVYNGGQWVNQTVSGGSSSGAVDLIQVSDGSGGFLNRNWYIDPSLNMYPSNQLNSSLGKLNNPVFQSYFGQTGIKILNDNNNYQSNTEADFASISTDGTNGDLIFKAISHNNNTHYEFKATDNSPAKLIIESGNGTNNFTLYANQGATGNQVLQAPQALGTNGQVLSLSGVSGDSADLVWASLPTVADAVKTESLVRINQLSVSSMSVLSGFSLPTVINYGYPCTLQRIYTTSKNVAPGDAMSVSFCVDNVIFTDNTAGGQIPNSTIDAGFSFPLFFANHSANDTFDALVSMTFVSSKTNVSPNSSQFFVTTQITKSVTMTSTSGGGAAVITLTTSELNSLLPSNATVATGSYVSNLKWIGFINIVIQNHSAATGSSYCDVAGAAAASATGAFGLALQNVL